MKIVNVYQQIDFSDKLWTPCGRFRATSRLCVEIKYCESSFWNKWRG